MSERGASSLTSALQKYMGIVRQPIVASLVKNQYLEHQLRQLAEEPAPAAPPPAPDHAEAADIAATTEADRIGGVLFQENAKELGPWRVYMSGPVQRELRVEYRKSKKSCKILLKKIKYVSEVNWGATLTWRMSSQGAVLRPFL
jgi:hypothetical protein